MRLIDTHCHLNLDAFQEDVEQVIAAAGDQGVQRILVPGTDLNTSRLAVELAEKYAPVFAAVGVHPNEATQWDGDSWQALQMLANHPKVMAIGEIGLDYYRDYAPAELQKKVLQLQLNLATECQLPVIIHSRQSLDDILPVLIDWQAKLESTASPIAHRPGVLHSYEGDEAFASQAIQHQFLLGITGPLTYPNAAARQELVRRLPIESLVVETDSPYLTPVPFRGRRNQPAYTLLVAEKIAELRSLPVDEVAEITSSNADRLFLWRASD